MLDRPYEPKVVELRNGLRMVVRMARDEDIPLILGVLLLQLGRMLKY